MVASSALRVALRPALALVVLPTALAAYFHPCGGNNDRRRDGYGLGGRMLRLLVGGHAAADCRPSSAAEDLAKWDQGKPTNRPMFS